MSFAVYLRWIPAAWLALLLAGCFASPRRLEPGESTTFRTGLLPGINQMIELETAEVEPPGAELHVSVGDILLPPIYAGWEAGGEYQPDRGFAARYWSSLWPMLPGQSVVVANRGPNPVMLKDVDIRHGKTRNLYDKARDFAPFPPRGWSDYRRLLDAEPPETIGDERAYKNISSLRAWVAERNRRAAFERIDGLPFPLRIEGRPLDDVQVRAALIGENGAIIGVSRRDPSFWKSIVASWRPPPANTLWLPIGVERPLPERFEAQQKLLGLAIYLSDRDPQYQSVVNGRVYRIDAAQPVAAVQWRNIPAEGGWVEMSMDPPLPPGFYVLELQAEKGMPVWMYAQSPSSDSNDDAQLTARPTMLMHVAPTEVHYDSPTSIRLKVVGTVDKIVHYGPDGGPVEKVPKYDNFEMVFEANLLPGQTRIYRLRNYRR